jgi:hypothetical protein
MRNTQGQWPSSIENNALNISTNNRSTGQNFYGNKASRGPHIADDNTAGDNRRAGAYYHQQQQMGRSPDVYSEDNSPQQDNRPSTRNQYAQQYGGALNYPPTLSANPYPP